MSKLPKVTELNTGRAGIRIWVWVALAWVFGAHVAPYLIGGACVSISRWQSLDERCRGEAGSGAGRGARHKISSRMT